jgi:hypothetical protein
MEKWHNIISNPSHTVRGVHLGILSALARSLKIHHHRAAGFARLSLLTLVMLPTLLPHTQKNLVEWGEKADASNLERGLLCLPVELTTEVLDYFPTIGFYTTVLHNPSDAVLPKFYLVRIDILRALSQVCIDYRRVFLPLLWDSLNLCFAMRTTNPKWPNGYDKHAGEAIVRNCDGLLANPNLASYIR